MRYTTATMGKDVLIMFFGSVVLLLPFLGFPNSWDTILFVLAGASTIALGILVRRERRRPAAQKEGIETYVEHEPAQPLTPTDYEGVR